MPVEILSRLSKYQKKGKEVNIFKNLNGKLYATSENVRDTNVTLKNGYWITALTDDLQTILGQSGQGPILVESKMICCSSMPCMSARK